MAIAPLLRILCDEHAPCPVVMGLRRRGLDAVTIQESGLSSADDRAVLDFALKQGRVIYTFDADFLRLHSRGLRHAGIIYHHPHKYSIGEAVRSVHQACTVLTAPEMAGNVLFL